mmetsp:Transcript_37000/g.56853  ORF Transcript_37000/g.56853 Transcript_37000/m.56853 type:complete len:441 (+) Transcript_37000:46-1368(+)|eukprot:CAMPEP_0118684854 /NCGR_PEP_ID=MMETSP0800-20121206/6890_1 /TAXON_ID=210618 ORGANISM="Striatella unipunctata, Strain CCMP2910" /NCGR_SAMPLE_ID=MMETSP0800 /ASSEMBLY_ACC=CAM_ASM_000638 /LENGTH=440 /DNA_ID=CAMNT_0006581637 /DNA_START=39 /DNA_END=1361 /DNA_ORIENTATION=+
MRIFHLALLLQLAAYQPGELRRRLFGEPGCRITLAPSLVNEFVIASESSMAKGLPSLLKTVVESGPPKINFEKDFDINQGALPMPYVKPSNYRYVQNALEAQRFAQSQEPAPFLKELTSKDCDVDPLDRNAQLAFFKKNSKAIEKLKLKFGCVYFKGWSVFTDSKGLEAAAEAMGMALCSDPALFLGARYQLENEGKVFEASNRQEDSKTHIGMHTEATPGFRPSTGIFACFKAAESGGEFLVCDGNRVMRDLDTETLERLEKKEMMGVLAEFPEWISLPPGPLKNNPVLRRMSEEAFALIFDLTKPTDEYQLWSLANRQDKHFTVSTKTSKPLYHHPVTNMPIWLHNFHAGHSGIFLTNNPHIKKATRSSFSTTNFDWVYGDGTTVTDEDVASIQTVHDDNTIALKMKPGDALMVDNWRTLHGRKPFKGERKHAVVWGV